MTEDPIKRSADGLSVGDRILAAYLPAVGDEPAEVVFVKPYVYVGEPWIFIAFRLPNGLIEATHYKPDNGVEIYPAPDPTGQPIAGRASAHFGAVVNEGGHTAVEVAGGLIEIDPPWSPETGFFEPGRVPELVGDDLPSMARETHIPHCPARYDSAEPCIPGCRESSEQRGVGPASAD